MFLTDGHVRLIGGKGFDPALASVDRANVADDHFIDGHVLKLRVISTLRSVVSIFLVGEMTSQNSGWDVGSATALTEVVVS
jgi:hypothetical protein